MDPAEPLRAAAERAARKHAEHGQHLGQRAALRRQHDADAHDGCPRVGLLRRRLPALAHLCQVVVAALRVLVERLRLAHPVEAHGRRGHQHLWALIVRGAIDCAHHFEGGVHARVHDLLLQRRRPPSRDGLAREVDHTGAAAHGLLPFVRAVERYVAVRQLGLRGAEVAAQHAHRVPLRGQLGHQAASDQAGRAGDGHRHLAIVARLAHHLGARLALARTGGHHAARRPAGPAAQQARQREGGHCVAPCAPQRADRRRA
mmetsp:Transcript_35772/g.91325  ORF Transcript_35772/g.91325 Transcript_35772/m.91325 type:complete len:259 (-) Transcript_35772:218-994(-)